MMMLGSLRTEKLGALGYAALVYYTINTDECELINGADQNAALRITVFDDAVDIKLYGVGLRLLKGNDFYKLIVKEIYSVHIAPHDKGGNIIKHSKI